MIDLFFRRPLASSSSSINSANSEKRSKSSKVVIRGLPPRLSFDRIINGETCYPCRLKDFMNYMHFVEHDSENLRFYLWHQSYTARFNELALRDRILSPPYFEDPLSPNPIEKRVSLTSLPSPEAIKDQPLRSEVQHVASLFLYPASPYELNLSSRDRQLVLRALSQTTHPSVFVPALLAAETALRHQSHPNFIRRITSNANAPRALSHGITALVLAIFGLVLSIFFITSDISKGFRCIPGLCIGGAVLLWRSNRRKFCMTLFFKGRTKNLEEWELPSSTIDEEKAYESDGGASWIDDLDDEQRNVTENSQRSAMQKYKEEPVRIVDWELRRIHASIAAQLLLIGVLVAAFVTGILCTIPVGKWHW